MKRLRHEPFLMSTPLIYRPLVWFIVLLVVLLGVCIAFARTTSDEPYAYDEADYMYASTRGFWANYSDEHAMSFIDFLRKGYELSRDKTQRATMSQYVRSTGDISFYRHYHGPMYAYWLSLGHAFGLRSEAGFRASGLVLHALGAIAIFWLLLAVFPEMPAAGAFLGAFAFVLNRTALVTATVITQHIVFELVCLLALFSTAQYLRTEQTRWWKVTAVLLACALAAVEISAVLICAVTLSVVLVKWKEGVRSIARRLGQGAIWFLLSLVVLWPFGLLKLSAVKGYFYLAYMAISRKTFTPIGPLQLWSFKIRTYPFEFGVALAAMALLIFLWPGLRNRTATTPFVVYTLLFFGVTMAITLPYTHYHPTLLASTCVLVGVVAGELWQRSQAVARACVMLAVLVPASISGMTLYRETQTRRPSSPAMRAAIGQAARTPATPFFVPFEWVPTLHYYHPNLTFVGYDSDWKPQRLAQEAAATPSQVACQPEMCAALEATLPPGTPVTRDTLHAGDSTGELFYLIRVGERHSSASSLQ
jgi:hypothetical protein